MLPYAVVKNTVARLTFTSLIKGIASLAVVLICTGFTPTVAEDFLDPEQAYEFSAELSKDRSLQLHWSIEPGYSLYKERIFVAAKSSDKAFDKILKPEAHKIYDQSLQETIEKYHGELTIQAIVAQAQKQPFSVEVRYQGCADAGLCYPPIKKVFTVDPAKPGTVFSSQSGLPSFLRGHSSSVQGVASSASSVALSGLQKVSSSLEKISLPETPPSTDKTSLNEEKGKKKENNSSAIAILQSAQAEENSMQLATRVLQDRNFWKVGGVFFVFGLLLSFTPCVLPMVPILSSIIAGDRKPSLSRGLSLAIAYTLGMALVYTCLGIAAGLAGEGLAAALQNPWVLSLFAGLLMVLALSMFDVYQLQLPSSFQSYLNESSGRMKGGRFAGVFVMGAISALIVGPCVAAPLAGALLYISQTKDVWLGGCALFSMALGMGVPLLMTGLSMGTLLPKAGLWMVQVKQFFGLLLIGVAFWMISSLIPATGLLLMWGTFAVVASLVLGIFHAWPREVSLGYVIVRGLAIILMLVGVAEWIGALSGSQDPIKPLAVFNRGSALSSPLTSQTQSVRFEPVKTLKDLTQLSLSSSKPVLVDFYAEWCVACKEMERDTFTHPAVVSKMKQFETVRIDVTANTPEDKALLKKFNLFGPPALVMLEPGTAAFEKSRIVGYLAPDKFLSQLCHTKETMTC